MLSVCFVFYKRLIQEHNVDDNVDTIGSSHIWAHAVCYGDFQNATADNKTEIRIYYAFLTVLRHSNVLVEASSH